MAAVAVAGAATAQVSVTGALGFGWEGVSPAVGASETGIKVTDGNVKFSASEDLGGGMSVLTAMDIQSRGRDTTIVGRDASITLVTGFGGFTLGAVEAGNGILGLGGGGAPVIDLDGNTAETGSGVLLQSGDGTNRPEVGRARPAAQPVQPAALKHYVSATVRPRH